MTVQSASWSCESQWDNAHLQILGSFTFLAASSALSPLTSVQRTPTNAVNLTLSIG